MKTYSMVDLVQQGNVGLLEAMQAKQGSLGRALYAWL